MQSSGHGTRSTLTGKRQAHTHPNKGYDKDFAKPVLDQ